MKTRGKKKALENPFFFSPCPRVCFPPSRFFLLFTGSKTKEKKSLHLSPSLSLSPLCWFLSPLHVPSSVRRSVHVRLVRGGVHQARPGPGLVRQLHLHHPAAAERVRVDLGRVVDERLVDLDDLARDGRVDVRGGLDGLDDAVGLAGGDLGADLGELDVDDVAELGLGRVGVFLFWKGFRVRCGGGGRRIERGEEGRG